MISLLKKDVWVFGSYKWQGNPKALFLYMSKYHEDKDCWWIADTEDQFQFLQESGFKVSYMKSNHASGLFAKAKVYVVENCREHYPSTMNPSIVILNLWHGVGLKNIELSLGEDSGLAAAIARKNIKNFKINFNNQLLLVTSEEMEVHFKKNIILEEGNIIRGVYPRNIVYQNNDFLTYAPKDLKGNIDSFDKIFLFAPTWRENSFNGIFTKLIPNLELLADLMKEQNSLLIVKLHPLMKNDSGYINAQSSLSEHPNILFWDDLYDIYELFSKIDIAIIDYSSIFYDLFNAGVRKFIRYIPDFEKYIETSGFIKNYFDHTDGIEARDFNSLLDVIKSGVPETSEEKINFLHDHFFGYIPKNNSNSLSEIPTNQDCIGKNSLIESIIESTEAFTPKPNTLPTLYSYDVFDTLIRRKTVLPVSIFYQVREQLEQCAINFPTYLVKNYPKIRRECEADVRNVMHQTTYERNTEKVEISFQQIFDRMQRVYSLTEEQINLLMDLEVQNEYQAVEPIHHNIERLHKQLQNGDSVVLISDMYLPAEIIRNMLKIADPRLLQLPLYLSSEIGHQKSTGKLFVHIFFDIDYKYSQWIHYGDNKHADGSSPRKLGISTRVHDIDSFISLESEIVNNLQSYDAYQVAANMQRYRWRMLDHHSIKFDEKRYFAYAYVGSYLVPYVNWAIKDAIQRGYEIIYFISRDGDYLKKIADAIILEKGYNIETHLIYGSRKAWRFALPDESVEDLFLSPFGVFGGVKNFHEVVLASQFDEEQLIQLVPELEKFKTQSSLSKEEILDIASILLNSTEYLHCLEQERTRRYELVRDYLKQEICFDKKFAFLEFWGRGYTQELLTKLICKAAEKPIKNPFYYVRCLRDDIGNSIRHTFTQTARSFWFMEPIFASVPYGSITSYKRTDNGIIPDIVRVENEFSDSINLGITDFTKDYISLNVNHEDLLDRSLADAAFNYHLNNPHDQFLCNVYALLKDNKGTYETVAEVAPLLSISDIQEKSIAEISKLAMDMKISLSRSSDAVRQAYVKKLSKPGAPPVKLPEKTKLIFPNQNLENYILIKKTPQIILSLKNQAIYHDISFNEATKSDLVLNEGAFAEVLEISWTRWGIPRLKLSNGYITAHRDYSQPVNQIVLLHNLQLLSQSEDSAFVSQEQTKNAGEVLDIVGIHKLNSSITLLKTEYGYLESSSESYTIVAQNISDYISDKTISQVLLLRTLPIYSSLENIKNQIAQTELLKAGTIVDIENIAWQQNGTPLLKTKQGYLSAYNLDVIFARSDIKEYIFSDVKLVKILAHTAACYTSVDFAPQNKKDEILEAGDIIKVHAIEWEKSGIPRLKTDYGYISAAITDVKRVRPDIDNYIHNEKINAILILQNIHFYSSVDFEAPNKTKLIARKGDIYHVESIAWTALGTPRIKTEKGYCSSNIENIMVVRSDIEKYIYKNVQAVRLLKPAYAYSSVEFSDETRGARIGKAGDTVKVLSIEWTEKGTPRLRTTKGFISANLENVTKVNVASSENTAQ